MTRIEEIKARHAKELAKAEAEDRILAKVPAGAKVFVSELYGRVARVSFGDEFREPATWAQAVELIGMLPPVSKTMVKDGCLSFRPRSVVEAMPESAKERWESESDVSPVLFHIEALHGPTLELEWTAALPEIGLVQVHVHLGHVPSGIGRYQANRVEFKGGFRYERARFNAAAELHTVHAENGESLAQLESPICWASGGPEYPNRMTIYFCDLGADADPAMVGGAIVRHLAKLATSK